MNKMNGYILEQYGSLKNGQVFAVVDSGRDWYLIQARGSLLYVPSSFVRIV